MPIRGRIAIGVDDVPAGGGARSAGGDAGEYDIAIGPLQESIVARGQAGAISVLAATDPGALLSVPDMYMKKIAVGPVARGRIDLTGPGRSERSTRSPRRSGATPTTSPRSCSTGRGTRT